MDEVGLGKDAAPGGYPGSRAFELQSQARKVLHADANPVCLLLQEPARASSTERIGGDFPRLFQAIFQLYQQRALTADLHDSFDVGVTSQQAGGNRQ